jgi:hypothetical protein
VTVVTGSEVIGVHEIAELRSLLSQETSHRLCVLAASAARTSERALALLKRLERSARVERFHGRPDSRGTGVSGVRRT